MINSHWSTTWHYTIKRSRLLETTSCWELVSKNNPLASINYTKNKKAKRRQQLSQLPAPVLGSIQVKPVLWHKIIKALRKLGPKTLASSMPRCVPPASPKTFQFIKHQEKNKTKQKKHQETWILKHTIQSSPALTTLQICLPPPVSTKVTTNLECMSRPIKGVIPTQAWGEASTIFF